METWTYMGDLPYPVSPGSYRYGTRAVSPQQRKKRVRLVYIKSGVKAPLLSDLEAKSTIRYGLDVVNGRSVPSNTPTTALEMEFEAPPPTANTLNGKRNASNYTKDIVYMEKDTSKLDFAKLHPYKWMSTPERNSLPSIAPDYMYQNTYISKDPDSTVSRTPSPEFKARRGLVMYQETANQRPQTVPENRKSSDQSNRLSAKPPRPKSKAVTFARESPNVLVHELKKPRANTKGNEIQTLEMNVKSFDQRTKLAGPNGCLHAKVKQSIKFIKKVERGEVLDLPQLPRPMHSEKGRYRPHSKTRVESAKLEVVSEDNDNQDQNKDFKSADVYLQIVKKSKSAASRRSAENSYSSMATPGMNEILAKYMNGGPYEETPRTTTVSVDVPRHSNPPVSRCSTRQSAVKIPEWAQEEKSRHIEEVNVEV